MSFHWWRNPGATYIACLAVLIAIGIGQSWVLRDELATAQLIKRDIIALNKQMMGDLIRWQAERRREVGYIEDERLSHREFKEWVMQMFPTLRQEYRLGQQADILEAVIRRLNALEAP